jgi:hypothetical protein
MKMMPEKTKDVNSGESMSNGLLSNFILDMRERARKKEKNDYEKTNKPVHWLEFILDMKMTLEKTKDMNASKATSQ